METMIASLIESGTYEGLNPAEQMRHTWSLEVSPAGLGLGPGSLNSPLGLSVTDHPCDLCMLLILSSCYLG